MQRLLITDASVTQTELERVQYGLGLVPTSAEMGVILGGLKTSVNALTELLTRSETELSATTGGHQPVHLLGLLSACRSYCGARRQRR